MGQFKNTFYKMTFLIIRAPTERQEEPQWEALDSLSLERFRQRLNIHTVGMWLHSVTSLSVET